MKLLRILVHLVVFVAVLELATRIDERLRFGTPLMSRVLSSEDLREFRDGGVQGRPNARYQKWGLNELGLRGPSTSREPRPGVIRIVTVGASETFGMAEAEGREYPRQLEDSLNLAAARRNSPRRYEVLNASLPGMSIPSILLGLRGHIRSLSPDVVVVYPSPSFYVDSDPPHAARDVSDVDTLAFTRALRPRVIPRIVDAAKSLLPAAALDHLRERDIRKSIERYPPGWRFTSIPQDRLTLFSEHMREIVGTIRSIGAEPILMTHGNAFMDGSRNDALARAWERFYPRATASTLIAFDSAARGVTLQVARDSGVVVVDVAADLARNREPVYSDFAHFTELGAARVAGDLSDSVRAVVDRNTRERDVAGAVLQASGGRVQRAGGGLQ
jgi:hypothetical protein